jgi:hypothetical protein
MDATPPTAARSSRALVRRPESILFYPAWPDHRRVPNDPFIASKLNDDPRKLLGDQTWQAMLDVSDVHSERRREGQARLDKIKWVSHALKEGLPELRCDHCGSDLLRPVTRPVKSNWNAAHAENPKVLTLASPQHSHPHSIPKRTWPLRTAE